jgi:rhomboid protease GluP
VGFDAAAVVQPPERAGGVVRRTPKATVILALVLVGMWLATEIAGGSTNLEVLRQFGMRRPLWGFSEHPWRLFASIFLHYGLFHLLSNLLAQLLLGAAVERQCGAPAVVFVFLFAGLCGGLASLRWSPQAGTVGASGAVFGLAGVELMLLWRCGVGTLRWRLMTTAVMVALFGLLGFQERLGPYSVDRWGHLGGLAGGLLASLALRPRLDWRVAVPLAGLLGGAMVGETSRGPKLF